MSSLREFSDVPAPFQQHYAVMVMSALGRFRARLLLGSVAATCALGLGSLAMAHGVGPPPSRPAAHPATGLPGAHPVTAGDQSAGMGAMPILLAARQSGAGHPDAATGHSVAGRGSVSAGRPAAAGQAAVLLRFDTSPSQAGSSRGQSRAVSPGGTSTGPEHPGVSQGPNASGHGRKDRGASGHGRRLQGAPASAAPVPRLQIESTILVAPSAAPTPATRPAATAPARTARSSTRLGATPGAGATSAGSSGRSTPGRAPSSQPAGSASPSRGLNLLAPVVAGLPPLSLLPMVGGLQVSGTPQIAIFVILANAVLAAAIVLASRRGRRLTRRSLEGGAVRGAQAALEDWPPAR
jgi:hypothetical protein